MSGYSCSCGNLKRVVSSVNDVVRDLVCPLYNSKLGVVDLSKQTKIDNYNDLDENGLSKMRDLIYGELKYAPATDCELAKRLGFSDPNKVRPRRFELVGAGKVKDIRKRPCCITGKKVIEWGIV